MRIHYVRTQRLYHNESFFDALCFCLFVWFVGVEKKHSTVFDKICNFGIWFIHSTLEESIRAEGLFDTCIFAISIETLKVFGYVEVHITACYTIREVINKRDGNVFQQFTSTILHYVDHELPIERQLNYSFSRQFIHYWPDDFARVIYIETLY